MMLEPWLPCSRIYFLIIFTSLRSPLSLAIGASLGSNYYNKAIGVNEGKCMVSSDLKILPGIGLVECSLECYRLFGCTTFNYRKGTKTCEITANPVAASFTSVPDCVLFESSSVQDCSRTDNAGYSGLTTGHIRGLAPFPVICNGQWTYIQRRVNPTESFNRTWQEYKQGFGTVNGGSFWLGNEYIHLITNYVPYQLRVDIMTSTGDWKFAEYSSFRLEAESDNYRLRIGQYSPNSNADDSFNHVISAFNHADRPFSTADRDHDENVGNCAAKESGGWWYNSCSNSQLNGILDCDISTSSCAHWYTTYKRLTQISMKIRPV